MRRQRRARRQAVRPRQRRAATPSRYAHANGERDTERYAHANGQPTLTPTASATGRYSGTHGYHYGCDANQHSHVRRPNSDPGSHYPTRRHDWQHGFGQPGQRDDKCSGEHSGQRRDAGRDRRSRRQRHHADATGTVGPGATGQQLQHDLAGAVRARGHGAGFRTGELYLDLHQRHGWRGRDGGLWWGQ